MGGRANIQLDMGDSDDSSRQYAWERGQIDYCSIDSFDIRRQVGASSYRDQGTNEHLESTDFRSVPSCKAKYRV